MIKALLIDTFNSKNVPFRSWYMSFCCAIFFYCYEVNNNVLLLVKCQHEHLSTDFSEKICMDNEVKMYQI